MELIDRNTVLNKYQEICNGTACMDCPFHQDGCAVEKLILESAVVDAEPVVHCKDCKFNYANQIPSDDECQLCVELPISKDFFCAYGEKMDEVNDD